MRVDVKPNRVAAVLLFGAAGLLALRTALGFPAADGMEADYLAWCARTGHQANEYALNCEQTGGFLDATMRAAPGDLAAVVALSALGLAALALGRTGRIATYLAAVSFPLWAYLSTGYYLNLPDRLARAAVLAFPDVVPQWYPTVSAAIGPVAAAGLLAAAATVFLAHRSAGPDTTGSP